MGLRPSQPHVPARTLALQSRRAVTDSDWNANRLERNQSDAFDCVVDTGFDGALILTAAVAERLNLSIVARLVFDLVGGARMSAYVALGEIEWLGQDRSGEVILSDGDDTLIGTELFEGANLILDYPTRDVTITQIVARALGR